MQTVILHNIGTLEKLADNTVIIRGNVASGIYTDITITPRAFQQIKLALNLVERKDETDA